MWTQIRLLQQEQSDLGPHCLSMRFQIFSGRQKHTFCILCALRVNKCKFSTHTVRIFMKCTHVCAAYYFFIKLLLEPDFPCLADEIVEPRPDMNIKVTAFTESNKFYYIMANTEVSRTDCSSMLSTPSDRCYLKRYIKWHLTDILLKD